MRDERPCYSKNRRDSEDYCYDNFAFFDDSCDVREVLQTAYGAGKTYHPWRDLLIDGGRLDEPPEKRRKRARFRKSRKEDRAGGKEPVQEEPHALTPGEVDWHVRESAVDPDYDREKHHVRYNLEVDMHKWKKFTLIKDPLKGKRLVMSDLSGLKYTNLDVILDVPEISKCASVNTAVDMAAFSFDRKM